MGVRSSNHPGSGTQESFKMEELWKVKGGSEPREGVVVGVLDSPKERLGVVQTPFGSIGIGEEGNTEEAPSSQQVRGKFREESRGSREKSSVLGVQVGGVVLVGS